MGEHRDGIFLPVLHLLFALLHDTNKLNWMRVLPRRRKARHGKSYRGTIFQRCQRLAFTRVSSYLSPWGFASHDQLQRVKARADGPNLPRAGPVCSCTVGYVWYEEGFSSLCSLLYCTGTLRVSLLFSSPSGPCVLAIAR